MAAELYHLRHCCQRKPTACTVSSRTLVPTKKARDHKFRLAQLNKKFIVVMETECSQSWAQKLTTGQYPEAI